MCCSYLLHSAPELSLCFPTYPAAVWTTVLCSCQVDVKCREQHLWQERWVYCSSTGNAAAFCYCSYYTDISHCFPSKHQSVFLAQQRIDRFTWKHKWEGTFKPVCILYIYTYHYAPSNESPHIFHLLCYPILSGILGVPIRKEQPYVQGNGQYGQWVQGHSDEAWTFSSAHGVLLASLSSVDLVRSST